MLIENCNHTRIQLIREYLTPFHRIQFFCVFFMISIGTSLQASSGLDSICRISNDLAVIRISDKVSMVKSFIEYPGYGRIDANGLLVETDEGIVLINTPWNDSLTTILLHWIDFTYPKQVLKVIITHSHEDCSGGMGEVSRRRIATITLAKTNELLKEKNLPVATEIFTDSMTYNLPSYVMKLYFLGSGHTIDNIVVWLPSEKILYGGCLVKAIESLNLGNTKDADLVSWPTTIKCLIRRFPAARIVIPGHGNLGGLPLMTHTLQLLTK